jgi:DNA invertase Pin-like site-specific DNA recombinase
MKSKRAAVYARVSTDENRQDPETQLRELREYAERRVFDVVGEYIDYASGKTVERADYKRLLEDARRRRLDVVLVWRYDRFARSTVALVNALDEFRSLGVDFISYQENVDTTTPQGELIFSIMASLAQFESLLISGRVKAGMANARAKGKQIGGARIPKETQEMICGLLAESPTPSIRCISKRLGLAYATTWRYVNELKTSIKRGSLTNPRSRATRVRRC